MRSTSWNQNRKLNLSRRSSKWHKNNETNTWRGEIVQTAMSSQKIWYLNWSIFPGFFFCRSSIILRQKSNFLRFLLQNRSRTFCDCYRNSELDDHSCDNSYIFASRNLRKVCVVFERTLAYLHSWWPWLTESKMKRNTSSSNLKENRLEETDSLRCEIRYRKNAWLRW